MDTTIIPQKAEFLKKEDSSQVGKLSMTTDMLIFSISDEDTGNYRKLTKKHFSILLVKRSDDPFKGKWCLPGGFVKEDEPLEAAADRILRRETNLKDIYMEQLYTFGRVDRDPRMRIVSCAYMALIDKSKLKTEISPNASWFHISFDKKGDKMSILLDNGQEKISFSATWDDNGELKKKSANELVFDHSSMIAIGIGRLKNKIEYTDVAFHLVPQLFTLGELQQVYEAILGKKLLAPAFRRVIGCKVQKTNQMKTGGGHRPSALFRYKEPRKD